MAVVSDRAGDRYLAKLARGSVARTPLDIAELVISSKAGIVVLTGKVKRPRGYNGDLNVRKEFENIKLMIRSMHGVRDIAAESVIIYD